MPSDDIRQGGFRNGIDTEGERHRLLPLTFRVSTTLRAALRQRARRHHRTVSQEIRYILEQAIATAPGAATPEAATANTTPDAAGDVLEGAHAAST